MVEVTLSTGQKMFFKDLEEYNKYVEAAEKALHEAERRLWYGEDYKKEPEEDEKN